MVKLMDGIYRSRRDRMIGGVAGGLAERFRQAPVLFRAGFIVLTALGLGAGLAVYAAARLLLPLTPETEGAAPSRDRSPLALGALAVALLFAGLGWLLWAGGYVEYSREAIGAVALVGIGALLVGSLGRLDNGWVMLAGLAIGVALAVPISDVDFRGSLDAHIEHPLRLAELDPSYSKSFGELRLDLGDLAGLASTGDTTTVRVEVVAGRGTIVLPAGVSASVRADITGGAVLVFGERVTALSSRRVFRSPAYDPAREQLFIDLRASLAWVDVEVADAAP